MVHWLQNRALSKKGEWNETMGRSFQIAFIINYASNVTAYKNRFGYKAPVIIDTGWCSRLRPHPYFKSYDQNLSWFLFLHGLLHLI